MKTIVKNQNNVIECECGTVIEYDKCDCSLMFSNKTKGLLQIIVKCPTCNKVHKVTLKNIDGVSIDNVETNKHQVEKDYSYAELKNNPELIEVGYQKEITLKNGLNAVFEVIGKNHDTKLDGTKAGLSFIIRDLLGKDDDENYDMPMNETWTNEGGWEKCEFRKKLNSDILALLPDELVDLIETVKKETYCDGKLVATEDKLWIPSESEMFGKSIYSAGIEGEQYEFFKYYRNRVKGHIGSDSSDWYWERSSISGSTLTFCIVNSTGGADIYTATNSRGVAFGFCL